jgi:hypothetical protein
MAAGAMGHQGRLYVEPLGSPHTFDSSSESYEFQNESLRAVKTLTNTNGIRGTRSAHVARTRTTQKSVQGTILFHPSPADFALWLPRIMGGAGPALAETLPYFGVLVNRVTQTFEYEDCVVNRATIRGTAGGLVECELDIIGKDENVGTSAPSVTLGVTAADEPYVFADLTCSLDATAREVFNFTLIIDNAIQQRFVNSLTATQLNATDRIITFSAECPYTGDEDDLYDVAEAGIAAVLTLTNGAVSTVFTMPGLQIPAESPVIRTRNDEIRLVLNGTARRTSGSAELTVTNDATP